MDISSLLPNINLFAILIAGLGATGLGFAWHSPMVFGKIWEKLMNLSPEQIATNKAKNMAPIVIANFITDVLSAGAILAIANLLILTTTADYFQIAGLLWLGGIVPMAVAGILWEGKSWRLAAFNSAYRLATFAVMAAIIVWLG